MNLYQLARRAKGKYKELSLIHIFYNIATVGIGQLLSCYLLGIPLLKLLRRMNVGERI